MAKSFLARVQPTRQRWKLVDWPFPVDDEERPKIKVRVLSQREAEAAHLAAFAHFKAQKATVKVDDQVFIVREHVELVFLAYSADGESIADDANELAEQPLGIIEELYSTFAQFQADVCAVPHTAKEMGELVDLLKKNMAPGLLSGLPSSWLIGLISTLVSQLSTSTPANELG